MAALLRPRHERLTRGANPAAYEEDEVRARIYGWHSGTVEPPQPVDSSRVAGIAAASAGGAAEAGAAVGSPPSAEQVMPRATAPRKGDHK